VEKEPKIMGLSATSKNLPISAIRESDLSWKRDISEADLEELSENMALIGQLHPVVVRPMGKAGRLFELLAGRRRYLALKKMKADKIRCSVVKCNDKTATIISLSENLKTKKPNEREWESGMHRLTTIIQEDHEREAAKEAERRAVQEKVKPKQADKGVSGHRAQKPTPSVGGRPKSPKREAVKEAAKLVGVSESTAMRAVKRVENLIPSAARALETGKINIQQANRLANMTVSDQRRQLLDMVKENRDETRDRLRREREKEAPSKDRTSIFIERFQRIGKGALELSGELDDLLDYVDGKEVDWDRVLKAVTKDIGQIQSTMKALTKMIDWLLNDEEG
jgi:ParB family chromosome partitioning protein